MPPTKVVADIISLSAQGKTLREISDKTGMPKSTINDYQHRLRSIIDAECGEIINSGLTASRKTLVKFAQYGASEACIPGETCDKWAKISADSSKTIVGLIATSQPSTVINNLIQINNAPEMSQEIKALQGFMSQLWDEQSAIGKDRNNTIEISSIPVDIDTGTTSLASPHTSAAAIDLPALDNVAVDPSAIQTVDNPVDKSSTPQVAGNVYRGKRKKST